jgi:hypothetical protein
MGWFLARHARVPLLGLVDLGFHELGHLVAFPLPEVLTAAAGSVTQVAVPAGLAGYFLFRRHDRAAAAVCLAWAATSAADAAVYIADAPYEQLELIGGYHDWAFVLGELGWMEHAARLAAAVRWFAWMLLAVAVLIAASPWLQRAWRPAPRRTPARFSL